MMKMPPHIAGEESDERRLRWARDRFRNPEPFLEKIQRLYAHPEETCHDEVELTDGTILDRHSFSRARARTENITAGYGRFETSPSARVPRNRCDLLNSAVVQSRESILITDAGLDLPGPRIVFVNPAFTKMTGYTAEEAIGKTPRILQGPSRQSGVEPAAAKPRTGRNV